MKETEKYILNYRKSIENNKIRSENDFEKHINIFAGIGVFERFLRELERRNNIIETLNDISVSSLIVGVFFFIILLVINI